MCPVEGDNKCMHVDSLAARLSGLEPVAISRGHIAASSPAEGRLLARALTTAGHPARCVASTAEASRARRSELIAVSVGTPERVAPGSPARFLGILADVYATGHDLEPRTRDASGAIVPVSARFSPGKALAERGDGGVGSDIEDMLDKPDGEIPVELRRWMAGLVERWRLDRRQRRITAVVAAPHPTHLYAVVSTAAGVAGMVGARYVGRLMRTDRPSLDPTKLALDAVRGAHVLLVSMDELDVAFSARLLRGTGALSVTPLTWVTGPDSQTVPAQR